MFYLDCLEGFFVGLSVSILQGQKFLSALFTVVSQCLRQCLPQSKHFININEKKETYQATNCPINLSSNLLPYKCWQSKLVFQTHKLKGLESC